MRMEPDSTKVLQARFDELPDDVQRAIQSADADKKIQEVGQKHRLHVDQVASLDNETRLVMLGFVDPSEFADQIGIELKVSPEEADAIAAEISSALFMPIRESMQRFMEERSLQTQLLNEGKPASAAPMTPPSGGKNLSVVMPSAASAPAAPPAMPNPPVPKPLAPAPATPTPKPDMHAADVMLRLKADYGKMMGIFEKLTADEWGKFIVTHPFMGGLPTFFYPAFHVMDYGVHTWDIRWGLGEKNR